MKNDKEQVKICICMDAPDNIFIKKAPYDYCKMYETYVDKEIADKYEHKGYERYEGGLLVLVSKKTGKFAKIIDVIDKIIESDELLNKSINDIKREFKQEHKGYEFIIANKYKLCCGKYQETDDITFIPEQLFAWESKFGNNKDSPYEILDLIDLLNKAKNEEEKNKVMQFIFNLIEEECD